MRILQTFQTKNRSYKKNRPITPVGILVHSTGANNRNLHRYVDDVEHLGKNKYHNHWNSALATKSVHAWIGYDINKEVIVAQTLPYTMACWGAGKGKKGSANYDPQAHLQFEICQGSKTDADYYWKAITVAEEYCAYLCQQYGWGVDKITSHVEAHKAGYASNHGDPASWMKHFDDNMNQFRSRVAARLTLSGVVVPEIEETPIETTKTAVNENLGVKTVKVELQQLKNGSKGTQVKTLQRLLNSMFYDCGTVDGIWGTKTNKAVLAFQKDKGLDVDGIVGAKTWDALLK